jgi:hypothetical protein
VQGKKKKKMKIVCPETEANKGLKKPELALLLE